ncbi:hypothetical protein CDIK_2438 [Cucumispora dikerogammari]|nr:hypothetical protein CDIK_2438 [Cucumispora dikerogammari]
MLALISNSSLTICSEAAASSNEGQVDEETRIFRYFCSKIQKVTLKTVFDYESKPFRFHLDYMLLTNDETMTVASVVTQLVRCKEYLNEREMKSRDQDVVIQFYPYPGFIGISYNLLSPQNEVLGTTLCGRATITYNPQQAFNTNYEQRCPQKILINQLGIDKAEGNVTLYKYKLILTLREKKTGLKTTLLYNSEKFGFTLDSNGRLQLASATL